MNIKNPEHEQQSEMQKLFKQARKAGYSGSFSTFCELRNKMETEKLVSKNNVVEESYFNDKGSADTPKDQSATMVESTAADIIKEHTSREIPFDKEQQYQQVQQPSVQNSTVAEKQKEEDEIFGMNKWVFAGLVILLISILGFGLAWAVKNYRKNKMDAVMPGSNTDNSASQSSNEKQNPTTPEPIKTEFIKTNADKSEPIPGSPKA